MARWVSALVVGLVSAGCQQPSGPGAAAPLLPANPMNGPTRIPPPPTGSIGGANAYTQPAPVSGQVSAGMRVNDLVAAVTPQRAAAAPVGSGVLAAGNTAAAGRSADPAPVRQVGFEASNNRPSASSNRQMTAAAATGLAPTIPAAAMTAPSYVDTSTPFRPQLRGMQPIDLTPTAPPSLRPVDSGNWAVVGENEPASASAIPSTQPVERSPVPVSAGPETAASRDPSRPAASTADSSLQWRRPGTAR